MEELTIITHGSQLPRHDVQDAAIIILHYGQPEVTKRCLASIHAGTAVPDIILLDNDPLRRLPVNEEPGMVVLPQTRNRGFAEGVNVGIRMAMQLGKDRVLLLNNDVEVAADTVARLLDTSRRFGCVAGGVELAMDQKGRRTSNVIFSGGDLVWGEVPVRLRSAPMDKDSPYVTDFVRGSCMAIPLRVIRNIGLMDQDYWAYGEDVDFCIRASRAGWPLMINPRARLWHRVSASCPRQRRNYLMARNAVRLLQRYTTGKVFTSGLMLGFLAALSSVVRPKRHGKFLGFFAGLAHLGVP